MPFSPIPPSVAAAPRIAAAAVACEKQTDCPAELLAAQCAIESGWLLHAPGNNCFGIKAYAGASGKQLLRTKEWMSPAFAAAWAQSSPGRTFELDTPVQTDNSGRHLYSVQDWFATFPSLTDCFLYRGRLFTKPPYLTAANVYRTDKDLPQLVRTIAPLYATDPNYADTVLAVMRNEDLQKALQNARRL
jgi:flagellar protein FlgJ